MTLLKYLFAFVALAMVASARVEADLYEICIDLGNMVGGYDAERAFAYGKWYLSTEPSLSTIFQRPRLIRAWDHVIHNPKCSPSSFNKVAIIARCSPSNGLKTLDAATRTYVKDCLTPEYIEDKIVSKSAGSISNTIYGDARKFIDSQFIDNYRKHNRKEPQIHLGTISGPNCCMPRRSISAIVEAIGRNLKKPAKEEFAGKKAELSSYLDKHLFTPCTGYWSALKVFMFNLFEVQIFFDGGRAEELIASMKPEVQNDVFRYNLCKRMESSSERKKIVDLVFDQI